MVYAKLKRVRARTKTTMSRWDGDLGPGDPPDEDLHPEIKDEDPDAPPPTKKDRHPDHPFAVEDPLAEEHLRERTGGQE